MDTIEELKKIEGFKDFETFEEFFAWVKTLSRETFSRETFLGNEKHIGDYFHSKNWGVDNFRKLDIWIKGIKEQPTDFETQEEIKPNPELKTKGDHSDETEESEEEDAETERFIDELKNESTQTLLSTGIQELLIELAKLKDLRTDKVKKFFDKNSEESIKAKEEAKRTEMVKQLTTIIDMVKSGKYEEGKQNLLDYSIFGY